jgi:hypothetical protein
MGTLHPAVRSEIHFLNHDDIFKEEKPFAFRYDVDREATAQTNMTMKPRGVDLYDFRGREKSFTLEKNGFEVLDVGDQVSYEGFHDKDMVGNYFEILRKLLAARLGARKVEVFRYGVSLTRGGHSVLGACRM